MALHPVVTVMTDLPARGIQQCGAYTASRMRQKLAAFLSCTGVSIALATFAAGCLERTIAVQSAPTGALVYLNDREIGRTPIQRDFTWYGTYDVTLRKDGYRTIKTTAAVIAPWYEFPPIDLFAELLPIPLTDHRVLSYEMQALPQGMIDSAGMVQRAEEMRSQLEDTRLPATQRSSGASTKPSHRSRLNSTQPAATEPGNSATTGPTGDAAPAGDIPAR